MKDCEALLPDLVDLSAGELPLEKRAAVERHLQACAACRQELAELGETTAFMQETRYEPHDLHLASFPARATERAERFRDRSVRGWWWTLTRGQRIASTFSTAALAAAVMLVVIAQPAPSGPTAERPLPGSTQAALAADDETPDLLAMMMDDEALAMGDGQYDGYADPNLDYALEALTDDELAELALLIGLPPGLD